jgi:hypothetical protein
MVKVFFKKKIFALILLILIGLNGFSQSDALGMSPYLFPKFTKGTVLMKAGIRNESMLNYNMLTQEMIFDNKGTKMAIGQLESIDTVSILTRKFVPNDKTFIELVYKSNYSLFVQHKSTIKDPGKTVGFSGTSQTSSVTNYSSILSGGQAYELKLPQGMETETSVVYWLQKGGELNNFLNIRQLSKLFKEKDDVFKAYLSEHEVKFDDQNSIIEFLRYLEAN